MAVDLQKKTVSELWIVAKRLGLKKGSDYVPKATLIRRIQRKKAAIAAKPKRSVKAKKATKKSAAKNPRRSVKAKKATSKTAAKKPKRSVKAKKAAPKKSAPKRTVPAARRPAPCKLYNVVRGMDGEVLGSYKTFAEAVKHRKELIDDDPSRPNYVKAYTVKNCTLAQWKAADQFFYDAENDIYTL